MLTPNDTAPSGAYTSGAHHIPGLGQFMSQVAAASPHMPVLHIATLTGQWPIIGGYIVVFGIAFYVANKLADALLGFR